MQKLKRLDELIKVDPTNEAFAILDGSIPEGHRPLALTDRYSVMAGIEMSEKVPEDIRDAFVVAQNLWLYGWFYWPFYTLASFHAFSCLEMALRRRCKLENIRPENWPKNRRLEDRSPGLKWLLDKAIEKGWIHDDEILHAKRAKENRLEYEALPVEKPEAPPDPWEERNQKYCKILSETIPFLRNEMAHPAHYWHAMPNALDFELARDLIEQLFPQEGA
jgi:hypothetical protein